MGRRRTRYDPAWPTARSPTTPARTTTDAANPRPNNPYGHILRWQNTGGDHGATTFVWSAFALAGAGLGTGDGSTIAPGDAFGSPDGLAFDPDGRLWIQTDGSQPIAVQQPDARRRSDHRRHPPLPGRARRAARSPAGR